MTELNSDKRFEVPDNYPDSNTYLSYPLALRPDVDNCTIIKRVHTKIFVEIDQVIRQDLAVYYEQPSTGEKFNGIKFSIETAIPTEPVAGKISQGTIDALNAKVTELKTEFGIA